MSYVGLTPQEQAELGQLQLKVARQQASWYRWAAIATVIVPVAVIWHAIAKKG